MARGLGSVVDAYLARLRLKAEPPSVDALFAIHRAHVERVAYETLWIHTGQVWGIEPTESMTRIATTRRGGYCFHLNGALSELLLILGYRVVRHIGGVHGPDGPTEGAMANHLVVTVHDLPSDSNPLGVWYVDVGLGDALYEPIPLIPGAYRHEPFDLLLESTPGSVGDWHLTHDSAGAFTGMAWFSSRAEIAEFSERHAWLSTSPESGFVRVLTAQRRDSTGVDILRALSLKRIGAHGYERTLESPDELFDALGDVFDLDVAAIDDVSKAAVWKRVYDSHLAWEADRE